MNKKFTLAPRRVSNAIVALVGLGLFVVLAFSFSALFASQSYQRPQTVGQSELSTSKNSQIDPSTEWNVYHANLYAIKYGSYYHFSLKYPPGWQPREHDYGTGFDIAFLSPDYRSPKKGMLEEVLDGGRIEVFIYPYQKFSKLEDWFNSFYANPYLHSINKKPQQISIFSGTQGIEFELIGKQGLNEVIHAKAFAVGDTIYLFQAVFKENPTRFTSVLDQMISTFTLKE